MGTQSSDRCAREDRPAIRSLTSHLIAGKLILVGALALAVTEISLVARADVAVAGAIQAQAADWLTSVWLAVSDVAATEVILLATTIIVGLLIVGNHWRGAVALALSVITAQAVVQLLKLLVSRPRPEEGAIDPSGFSFPSAHSASAVALYLMLAVIVTGLVRQRLRTAAYVAAVLVVALVGFSRVYLGAHYPTDVLAGWLLGGVIVLASWRLCSRLPAPAPAPA